MRLSDKQARAIMRNRKVRTAQAAAAARIAARARQITETESGQAQIGIESGIRPGGRPFVNVTSDRPDEEFGTSKTQRRRQLGRAAHGG